MVLVCPERSAAEPRATVCAGKLTIIAITLFAVAERGLIATNLKKNKFDT